jgi:16S rRNA G527 N7-methylase RsmG
VKHPATDPEAIGRETRRLVQAWLGDHPGIRLDPHFLERVEKLAAAICVWGSRMNLTADPSNPTQLAFHILDSLMPLVLVEETEHGRSSDVRETMPAGQDKSAGEFGGAIREALGERGRVLDLGAGAGFPGLVLAAATPARFGLLEARRKRASFLSVTAAEMELRNVTVEAGRGVQPRMEANFDLVVARAFGQPSEVHRAAAKALRTGGVAILYANPGQRLDLDAARAAGLGELAELPYSLVRGDAGSPRVDRILAVWRKL